jgi:hypothetical protein
MSRFTPQYHVACQIQKKILAKMGIRFAQANRVPKSAGPDCDLSPKDLAVLAGSWNTIEERKRILRMKPKPRDQEVTDNKKAKVQRAVFTE